MPWIPGVHRRGICAVQCVSAHLRGFEEDSRSELSSGLLSCQLSSAITGLMLLTFTTTHLLTSRPTLRSRSPCASWAPPFTRGLCGDLSPHRTTMTQTKCCPILHFGLWWLHLLSSPVSLPSSRPVLAVSLGTGVVGGVAAVTTSEHVE